MDFQRFAQLGAEGVLVMLGDSTNVDRKGVSGSERDVVDGFEEVFTSARGRIVIALFSSSLYRMQILVDLADQFDRKVAFVGRGVIENSQIAMRLGYLRIPPGVQIQIRHLTLPCRRARRGRGGLGIEHVELLQSPKHGVQMANERAELEQVPEPVLGDHAAAFDLLPRGLTEVGALFPAPGGGPLHHAVGLLPGQAWFVNPTAALIPGDDRQWIAAYGPQTVYMSYTDIGTGD